MYKKLEVNVTGMSMVKYPQLGKTSCSVKSNTFCHY